MVLKTDIGLHVQKENYNILLMNIKANKENQRKDQYTHYQEVHKVVLRMGQ